MDEAEPEKDICVTTVSGRRTKDTAHSMQVNISRIIAIARVFKKRPPFSRYYTSDIFTDKQISVMQMAVISAFDALIRDCLREENDIMKTHMIFRGGAL